MPKKEQLQLTPKGINRYYELGEIEDRYLTPRQQRQLVSFHHLIILHPLDYYLSPALRKLKPNYSELIRLGYAIIVSDKYKRMHNILSKVDPELLRVLETYKRIAHEENPSEAEIDRALVTFRNRIATQEPYNLEKIEKAIGSPKTKAEKVIALDAVIHTLHYDPDMLRALPKRTQPLVGSAIISWLNQLAAK